MPRRFLEIPVFLGGLFYYATPCMSPHKVGNSKVQIYLKIAKHKIKTCIIFVKKMKVSLIWLNQYYY